MNKISVLLVAILLPAFGCKKDNSLTTTVSVENTTPNFNTVNGFGTTSINNINGILFARCFTSSNFGVGRYEGWAIFDKLGKPFSVLNKEFGNSSQVGEEAGVVKANNITLKYYNYIYGDTTGAMFNPSTWSVSGNKNFGAFIANVVRGFPKIANTNFLPNNISKSQPLTIHFGVNNYSNTDSLMVSVSDNASPHSFSVYKYVSINDSSVTFTPAELSGLLVTTISYTSTTSIYSGIGVYAKNYSNINTEGKNYIFIMENCLSQFITIYP